MAKRSKVYSAKPHPPEEWKPKTAAVRRMLKLRERFIANGGVLLDQKGIADELRSRRGGIEWDDKP